MRGFWSAVRHHFVARLLTCTTHAPQHGCYATGRYGASPNVVDPACSGPCSPGYVCPPGSTTPTAVQCPGGRYSPGGASNCSDCSAGRWASEVAQVTDCTSMCPPGTYCLPASAAPAPCPAGRYGSTSELSTSACTAACDVGRYCPVGAGAPTKCPAGELGMAPTAVASTHRSLSPALPCIAAAEMGTAQWSTLF